MSQIPRGKIIGEQTGGPVGEHHYQCPQCGAWVDERDLGAVFDHEQPHTQPPAEDRPQ